MQLPEWRFDAIGTPWQIDTDVPLPPATREAVRDRIEAFDRTYSRFRRDSLVTRVGTAPGEYTFPPDADRLFGLYAQLAALTDGAMSPFVGGSLEQLGYDASYSLRPHGDPRPAPAWGADSWCAPVLTVGAHVTVDVGAAGKGYLADLVAEVLVAEGVRCFTVDASGDLVHRGPAPLRVALEHPGDPTRAVGVVELAGGRALCASAVNRRAWGEGLHHVLDARTGRPTSDVVATWVVADEGIVADALATALFFVPAEHLAEHFDFAFVRMTTDGRLEHTADLPGEIF